MAHSPSQYWESVMRVKRQEDDKYIVRLPDGMRDQIKSAASENQRSMNAEIIFQLNRAYGDSKNKKADAQRA